VNSVIRSVLEDMKSRGVTRENVSEKNASSFSTQLVKVDDWGNIHTYIYMKGINKENIAELESREVRIELVNEKWGIVQGWIPFDRVEEIAGLDFVEKITNPDYGVRR